jgi:curved DNA-binding protein CbpA
LAFNGPHINLYALLGVKLEASQDELRASFRNLSKRFHPDTTELPAAEASERFRALQDAMAVLSDPEQRRKYDSSLNDLFIDSSKDSSKISNKVSIQQTIIPERRALSGGELFALLLLGGALVFSLLIGLTLAFLGRS